MKRIILIVPCFILLLFVSACTGSSVEQPGYSSSDTEILSTEKAENVSTGDFMLPHASGDIDNHPLESWKMADGLPVAGIFYEEKCYYVRNSEAEVEQLGADWVYVGHVSRIVGRGFDFSTVAGEEGIISNCMLMGCKVYQWKYLLAVEYEDYYVIFKDSAID